MSISSSTVGGRIKYKIVLLGDQQVGKTSIIERFIHDRYQQSYNATIGIDFLVKNLVFENKSYRLQLWDTAGQERFKSLIPNYLKDSNLCILIYDLNNLKSLQNVEKWMELYNQNKEYTALCIIVGNKKDVGVRKCSPKVIEEKMKEWKDCQHFQVSAKTGQGVNDLFFKIIQLVNNRLNNIHIIDEIEQKSERYEKEEKMEWSETVKPVLKYESTSITLNNIEDIPLDASQRNKRKCC